jgi:hypothetical protein
VSLGPAGYELAIDSAAIDAVRFEQLVTEVAVATHDDRLLPIADQVVRLAG